MLVKVNVIDITQTLIEQNFDNVVDNIVDNDRTWRRNGNPSIDNMITDIIDFDTLCEITQTEFKKDGVDYYERQTAENDLELILRHTKSLSSVIKLVTSRMSNNSDVSICYNGTIDYIANDIARLGIASDNYTCELLSSVADGNVVYGQWSKLPSSSPLNNMLSLS